MLQKGTQICKKCRTSKPQIIVQKDPVCKECFIGYVEHAFKMTLRLKCSTNQKNERLLICFSGGQNSTALVKLIGDVVNNTCAHNKNKMFILADVLHINESIIMKEFIPEFKNQEYEKFVTEECKLPYNSINIESIYSDKTQLFKQLYNLPNFGSSREDFIHLIKLHIIYNHAIKFGFTKICFGQNGQRLAANLFSHLSKGRGLSLQFATKYSFEFKHPFGQQPLLILNPLKDLMNKDILYYLKLKENQNFPQFHLGMHISNEIKNKPNNGNIDHLLQNFIDKLQESFPSTTFTVLSSAEKVLFKPIPQQQLCPLCLQQIDQVYNRLEVETLDNSNQKLLQYLSANTKYFNIICFTCKRMIQQSNEIEDFYNLKNFPQLIIEIANKQQN